MRFVVIDISDDEDLQPLPNDNVVGAGDEASDDIHILFEKVAPARLVLKPYNEYISNDQQENEDNYDKGWDELRRLE